MSDEAIPVIQAVLGPRERILWAGKPRAGLVLRPADAFLIPFSLLWGGGVISVAIRALPLPDEPLGTKLFLIPFVLIGLYLLFGRFIVDALQRANTYYGLTNERIIILSKGWGSSMTTVTLSTLTDFVMDQQADGSGTIFLGPQPATAWWNGSLPGFGMGQQRPAVFEGVPNVKEVYELLRRAQGEARRARDGA